MKRIRAHLRAALQVASGATLLAPALLSGCTTTVDADPSIEGAEVAVTSEALSLPGFVTSVKPYVVAITPEYAFQALLSVGDRVPRTSNPTQQYQYIGIPDGMGAYRANGETFVYVNHELTIPTLSEPIIGQPLNRGAHVSLIKLDSEGRVVSGDRAYNTIWHENDLVGAAPDVSNTTAPFARFCSGSLAYREHGFDRPVFLAGEESTVAQGGVHDGMGGLTVAIFDGELHTMPKFGRFSWENTLAQPKRGDRTLLMGMEDGPATPDNQLYMYIGTKERTRGATGMRRNGLDNGYMYVFISDTPGITTEPAFTSGSITGHWVVIEDAEDLTDVELEAASDALGAFGFIRPEDGAFDPDNPDVYYFVTTGGGTGNQLGRLYKMTLDAEYPTENTTIELIYNADAIIAAGGDIAVSPDNIDVSRDYIMINEDGTAPSRIAMANAGRDGSVWRLDKNNGYAATRVAELFPPGQDGNFGVTSGIWETTGVITVKGFGNDAWLMNAQAHPPTVAPAPNTVEDGQLVLMRRTHFDTLFSE